MNGLTGKVALVVGGGQGVRAPSMGEATALRLAEEGCRVVIGDLHSERAEQTVAAITGRGGQAAGTGFDLADETSVRDLVQFAVECFGGIDLLANVGASTGPQSAYARDTDVLGLDTEVWEQTLQVNLRGYFFSSKFTIPEMIKRGGGAIVCWSSIASVMGMRDKVAYAVSKAGIEALVRHITTRFASDGIRANVIAPGGIRTGTWLQAAEEYGFSEANMSPYGRAGRPEEIAALAAFLLSEDAPSLRVRSSS